MHIKSMSVMTSALLVAQVALANVWINEVQSSNDSTCVDENGESPDWIELYNDGAEDVDLSGWGLSDKATKPFKWTFPQGTVIRANDYLLIYADGIDDSSRPVEPEAVAPEDSPAYEDLVCWLRADDALASCGDGGAVSFWQDRSLYGNSASNLVVSQQPIVVAGTVNEHAALNFSMAKANVLDLPVKSFNGMTNLANITVLAVQCRSGKYPTDRSHGGMGIIGLSKDSQDASLMFEYLAYGFPRLYNGSASACVDIRNQVEVKKNKWEIYSFSCDSDREVAAITTVQFGRNKLLMSTAEFEAASLSDYEGRLTIGDSNPYVGRSLDGSIAEILIFRRSLTKNEYNSICRYLEDRYCLMTEKKVHASFSLSGDGETLSLTPQDAVEPADTMTFSRIPCDTSFGRLQTGGLGYFKSPTPGALNSEMSFSEPLSAVEFSVPRGTYSEPFDLILSHDDPTATIIYTLDHSEPTLDNGIVANSGDAIRIRHTTIVRAVAFKDGSIPCRNIQTQSYVFLNDVFGQRPKEGAPVEWEGDGVALASYGLSSNVVCDAASSNAFLAALQEAPIVSVTLPDEDLFGKETGIYGGKQRKSEFGASVEWVSGDLVFGLDAGLKIQGHTSYRFNRTPKKSFRLIFRGRYGAGKLEQPVLKDGGYDCAEFNTLILRAEHNFAWPTVGNEGLKGTSMKDQFARDVQGRIAGYQSAGTHIHLFLNGLYWGLYNVSERPDAESASLRFGGQPEDYGTFLTYGATGLEARDGDGKEYQQRVLDLYNEDLSSPDSYAQANRLFKLNDFADYMLIEGFFGNVDWGHGNWVVLGAPEKGVPYRFYVWDTEQSMLNVSDNVIAKTMKSFWSPLTIERFFEGSAEYRLLFADRAHKLLFNEGELTESKLREQYLELAEKVRKRVFAESARWGAYQHDYVSSERAVYGLEHWDAERDRLMNVWLPARKEKFMSQLKALGLYPDVGAPEFMVEDEGKAARLTIPGGAEVYYTTDGEDPRVPFENTTSLSAVKYQDDAAIMSEAPIRVLARARSLSDGSWSALSEMTIVGSEPPVIKNEFLPSANGENWDKDTNWSLGCYPDAPGATAVIGIPTEFKKDKGWRNIHINKNDVTVGHVEMTNGGCTNRIDTGKSGNLIFCGDTNEVGEVVNSASFVVTDTGDSGLAMIDLDDPNIVSLASDVEFCVSNTVGDVDYGGMLCKGKWAGNGHNLLKSGPGRMTIDFSCADGYPAFGKLQVAEGVLAILKPVRAESITKEGECWVKGFAETLDEVTNVAVVCSEKVSVDNPCLFVPTFNGGNTFYGGFVAPDLKKASKCKVYVRDDSGTVRFAGGNWTKCSRATVSTVQLADGRLTYSVTLPKLVEDPPEFVPSQDPSIVISAESKADAILKVVLVAPSGEDGLPVVDSDSYTAYFKLSAASGETAGSFVVTAELDKESVAADDSVYDVAEALRQFTPVDVGDALEATVAAKPGLFYSILSTADLNSAFAEGARTLATGSTVQLRVPFVDSKSAGFYRIKVSASEK